MSPPDERTPADGTTGAPDEDRPKSLAVTVPREAEDIDAEHARELTERIKIGIAHTWELITEAWQCRADVALGYPSWDDYCASEFGTSRLRLPREERDDVVTSMRAIGMSTRAIASATGASVSTIHAAGVQNRTPARAVWPEDEPTTTAKVIGIDGKRYPATHLTIEPTTTEPTTIEPTTIEPARPPAVRRPSLSLPATFKQALVAIEVAYMQLDNLCQDDDRFPRLAVRLADNHRFDLVRIQDLHSAIVGYLYEPVESDDDDPTDERES